MWKWMGLFLRKNHLLRWWILFYLLNWNEALTSLFLKLHSKKLVPWFVLWSFFLLRFLCISIDLPCSHAWNTVVMPGLVLVLAIWNCWISYKNARLFVLHLLPFLNPWFIIKMFIWTGWTSYTPLFSRKVYLLFW